MPNIDYSLRSCQLGLHACRSKYINQVPTFLYMTLTMILKPICLCLLFLNCTRAEKVINFEDVPFVPIASSLSFATVTSVPTERLPDRFTICSTTRQTKIDGKSPFVLYGEDNHPWLAFSLWKSDTGVVLWAEVQNSSWGGFHHLRKPWTHRWIQVCALVDTVSGDLTVSLDGQTPITVNLQKMKTKKPNYLEGKLVIGLANTSTPEVKNRQFFGVVTELNIFYPNRTLQTLSRVHGDFMSWSKINFDFNGAGIALSNYLLPETSLEKYDLVLPLITTWGEAQQYCRTLGKGNMTAITDEEDLKRVTDMVMGAVDYCIDLSLPVSDVTEDGVFKNTDHGGLVTFLPWAESEPNGGKSMNAVVLRLGSQNYWDVFLHHQGCVSCSLKSTTIFTLRGLCKDSLMG